MSTSSILVVCQDDIYLEQVRSALSPAGYEIFSVSSAAAAFEHLQSSRPHVVVVCPGIAADMRDEITDTVKVLYPGLTVLLLTPNHIARISDLLQ